MLKVVVKEEWIAIAILRLVELEKCVVEGAGAAGLAAILAGHVDELKGKRFVFIYLYFHFHEENKEFCIQSFLIMHRSSYWSLSCAIYFSVFNSISLSFAISPIYCYHSFPSHHFLLSGQASNTCFVYLWIIYKRPSGKQSTKVRITQ